MIAGFEAPPPPTRSRPIPRSIQPTLGGLPYGLHAKGHQSRHEIRLSLSRSPPLANEFHRLGRTVALPPRGFGWRSSKKVVVEQAREAIGVHLASESKPTVAIHALRAPGEKSNHFVDQNVRRPNIEGTNLFRVMARREPSDVGDASQVQHQSTFVGGGHGRKMKKWSERSSLATRGEVPGTKIRNHAAAGPLRNHRSVRDLQTAAHIRVMRHGLPVGRNPVDIPHLHAALPKKRKRCSREGLTHFNIEFPQISQRIRRRFRSGQSVNPLPEFGFERKLPVVHKAKRARLAVVGPLDKGSVDGVRRGPRHQANPIHDAMVGGVGRETRRSPLAKKQRLTETGRSRILRSARPSFGAVSQHLESQSFRHPLASAPEHPGPRNESRPRLSSRKSEHPGMNDASRTQGWAICIGVAVLALGFLIGLLQQSYWAIALPIAILVFFVLGLAGWVGFTIATIQVDAENIAEIPTESTDGETSS